MNVIIDKEFQSVMFKIRDDEYEGLKQSILTEGCRDPLVMWNNILIDGYNRYEICQKYNIEFSTVETQINFQSRDEVKHWIRKNQLGKRNLTQEQRNYLIGLEYKEQKQSSIDNLKQFQPKGQNVPSVNTAEQLAETYKVNEKTVKRAEKFADAVDVIAVNIGDDVRDEILSRELDITAKDVQILAKQKPEVQKEVVEKVRTGKSMKKAIRESKNEQVETPPLPEGKYNVIVIDPPWPMEKIEREVAPNQIGFDYPTMSIVNIRQLKIPCADNCHVWLWTTQKYLPVAFEVLESWELNYVCCFTWCKKGGFQVYNLPQYNSEFVIYARKGSPKFLDTKDFMTSFHGKRREHSRKPDEFYNTITRVTEGKRLDMFSRGKRDGWISWGAEVDKF